jgi:hypothetical protein
MSNTMTLIQSTTVGSGNAASILFNNIPQTYTDLVMFLSSRSTVANNWTSSYITAVNGSGRSITLRNLTADGTTVSSGTTLLYTTTGSGMTANYYNNVKFYFPNYTNTAFNKHVSVDLTANSSSSGSNITISGGTIALTAAITSLTFGNDGSWLSGTTAHLYGIKNT